MEEMPLTLKGTQQGIRLKPLSASWEDVLRALETALHDAEAFFHGGRVILEMGERDLAPADLIALRTLLDRYEIELWAVLSENDATIHTARSYGLRTRLPGSTVRSTSPAEPDAAANALFVQRTLRSGQSLQYPGHIILVGDVNPGAEIVAGGNIVVWGRMRGMAHAGALGDESAIVCALTLHPTQLRIAGYISRAPATSEHVPQPEIAKVVNGAIVAEPWTTRES